MNINLLHILAFFLIVIFFSSFMLVEIAIAKKRGINVHYGPDTIANFMILVIRSSLNMLLTGALLLLILKKSTFLNLHLVDSLNKFSYWAILILGQDFLYYWFHRYSHECRWGWSSHIVHHSSNHLNYVTAVRESVTYIFSGIWIFWLPLAIVGYSPRDIVIATTISLVYQFFLHTQLVGKLGPLEYIFNTPSHHRVHHARNPQYLDKNYAGTLIIWDRMFGTFAEEVEAPEYGIVHQIYNYNPFYILFHGWYEMFRDVVKNKSLKYFIFFPK